MVAVTHGLMAAMAVTVAVMGELSISNSNGGIYNVDYIISLSLYPKFLYIHHLRVVGVCKTQLAKHYSYGFQFW